MTILGLVVIFSLKRKIYPFGLNLFQLTFVRIVLMVFLWPRHGLTNVPQHFVTASCPVATRNKANQKTWWHFHVTIAEHSYTPPSFWRNFHIALPWRSPDMILSVKVHSWAKRHISPCKGNDYQRTAKEACHHLRMGRMRRHWGAWYSHYYAPMFPARMANICIFL